MSARWWTLGVGALVAASAVHWGLALFVRSPGLPSGTTMASPGTVVQGDWTRLLGAEAPPPVAAAEQVPPDARFQLLGVLAPNAAGAAREGLALIAVDGKPAKAYRVGAAVDGQTVLKAVAARGAHLGPRDGPVQVQLALLPPQAATTGTLPQAEPPALPAPAAPPPNMSGAAPTQ